MIKFRWVCETCGESGEVYGEFSACTPTDIEQADIERARANALRIVKHRHPITLTTTKEST